MGMKINCLPLHSLTPLLDAFSNNIEPIYGLRIHIFYFLHLPVDLVTASGGNPLGLEIDTTKALTLPTACKVETPDVSLCSAIGIPVASPMGVSPAPASPGF